MTSRIHKPGQRKECTGQQARSRREQLAYPTRETIRKTKGSTLQAPSAARCFGRFRRNGCRARGFIEAGAGIRIRRSDDSASAPRNAFAPVDETMLNPSGRGHRSPMSDAISRFCLCIYAALAIALGACSVLPTDTTLPLGAHIARPESTALANPEQTKLGQSLEPRAREHQGMAGFRLISSGVACFRARIEMAALAEKTLDVQYYSIESDQTGRLFIQSLLDAADRGVRVRCTSCKNVFQVRKPGSGSADPSPGSGTTMDLSSLGASTVAKPASLSAPAIFSSASAASTNFPSPISSAACSAAIPRMNILCSPPRFATTFDYMAASSSS